MKIPRASPCRTIGAQNGGPPSPSNTEDSALRQGAPLLHPELPLRPRPHQALSKPNTRALNPSFPSHSLEDKAARRTE